MVVRLLIPAGEGRPNWEIPEPIALAGFYASLGAFLSGLALRLVRRPPPRAFASRLGVWSILLGGTYATVAQRLTRRIFDQEGVLMLSFKLWERSNGLTADDGAVPGGIIMLAGSMKSSAFRTGRLPTWQKYISYAGLTSVGAVTGGNGRRTLLFAPQALPQPQNTKRRALYKTSTDCSFSRLVDNNKLLAPSLGAWSLVHIGLGSLVYRWEVVALSPFPTVSPVSWLPQAFYSQIHHPSGNPATAPQIDWTLAARSSPQSSDSAVDKMTREAEFVASEIDRRHQSLLMLCEPETDNAPKSHKQHVRLSELQVVTLVRLQRGLLENIEKEKLRHSESLDVGAFLSSLDVKAARNRNHDPRASVSWLYGFLKQVRQSIESYNVQRTRASLEELQELKTSLEGLIEDFEKQSYAAKSYRTGE